jgi:hypothetical protein
MTNIQGLQLRDELRTWQTLPPDPQPIHSEHSSLCRIIFSRRRKWWVRRRYGRPALRQSECAALNDSSHRLARTSPSFPRSDLQLLELKVCFEKGQPVRFQPSIFERLPSETTMPEVARLGPPSRNWYAEGGGARIQGVGGLLAFPMSSSSCPPFCFRFNFCLLPEAMTSHLSACRSGTHGRAMEDVPRDFRSALAFDRRLRASVSTFLAPLDLARPEASFRLLVVDAPIKSSKTRLEVVC